jgi:hypothetical protein
MSLGVGVSKKTLMLNYRVSILISKKLAVYLFSHLSLISKQDLYTDDPFYAEAKSTETLTKSPNRSFGSFAPVFFYWSTFMYSTYILATYPFTCLPVVLKGAQV